MGSQIQIQLFGHLDIKEARNPINSILKSQPRKPLNSSSISLIANLKIVEILQQRDKSLKFVSRKNAYFSRFDLALWEWQDGKQIMANLNVGLDQLRGVFGDDCIHSDSKEKYSPVRLGQIERDNCEAEWHCDFTDVLKEYDEQMAIVGNETGRLFDLMREFSVKLYFEDFPTEHVQVNLLHARNTLRLLRRQCLERIAKRLMPLLLKSNDFDKAVPCAEVLWQHNTNDVETTQLLIYCCVAASRTHEIEKTIFATDSQPAIIEALRVAEKNDVAEATTWLKSYLKNSLGPLSLVFLERTQEMKRLQATTAQGFSRRAWVNVVTGEAGVGKTSLMRAHAQWLGYQFGVEVVKVRFSNLPLQSPSVQLLRAAVEDSGSAREVPFGPRSSPADPSTDAHKLLLDQILQNSKNPDVPPSMDETKLIRSTILQWFQSRQSPVLLMLDDAHNADAEVISTLQHLMAAAPTHGLEVLLAVTTGQCQEELLSQMTTLTDNDGLLVELAAFDEEQCNYLMGHLGIQPQHFSKIFELSAGNAFYVHELAKHSDDLNVLGDLGNLVLANISKLGLSKTAQDILEVCAVLQDEVSFAVLATIKGVSSSKLSLAREELLRHELISRSQKTKSVAESVRIKHGLIAEALRQSIPKDEQAGYLLACAEEYPYNPRYAAQLYKKYLSYKFGNETLKAQHLEKSLLSTIAKTFCACGVELVLMGETNKSTQWFEQAEKLIGQMPDLMVDFKVRRARALIRMREYKQVETLLQSCTNILRMNQNLSNNELTASIENTMALLQFNQTSNAQMVFKHAKAALAVLAKNANNSFEWAMAQNCLGMGNYQLGQNELALEHFYKALTVWEGLNHKERLAHTYGNIALVKMRLGRSPENLLEVENKFLESINIWNDLGQLTNASRAKANLAIYYSKNQRPIKAKKLIEDVKGIEDRLFGKDNHTIWLITTTALVSFYLENYQEAVHQYQSAFHTPEMRQSVPQQATNWRNIAECWLRLGQFEQFNMSIVKVRELTEGNMGTYARELVAVLFLEGDMYIIKNQHGRALKTFERCSQECKEHSLKDYLVECQQRLAALLKQKELLPDQSAHRFPDLVDVTRTYASSQGSTMIKPLQKIQDDYERGLLALIILRNEEFLKNTAAKTDEHKTKAALSEQVTKYLRIDIQGMEG